MEKDHVLFSGRFSGSVGSCCLRLTLYAVRQENEAWPVSTAWRGTKRWAAICAKFPALATESECASATIVSYVPCGLSFVRVETCCDGLTPEECAEAHRDAVEEVEKICEGM